MMKLSFLILLMLLIFPFGFGKTILSRNSLIEINACKGKVELSLIRIWGDENSDDENQFFKYPRSISISSDGLVYITDGRLDRIQVFDRQGNFKRSIGRHGQGPADFLNVQWATVDKNGNLIVADSGNRRVQAVNPMGEYLFSFRFEGKKPSQLAITQKNEIALYSAEKTMSSKSVIFLVDKNGKIMKEVGVNTNTKTGFYDGGGSEGIRFALDKEDNVYINYFGTPYFHKYGINGKSLMIVTYETPQRDPKVDLNPTNDHVIVIGKKIGQVSPAIAVDDQNRIFVILSQRPPLKEEIFIQANNYCKPKKLDSGKTNRFKLLVFNPAGKIIASKQLDVFCENIVVYKDRLFIIDALMSQQIFEYQMTFH